ncbi:unnamed protein product [Echinostoma caproni]|uniref:Uncharacterized protein n=1 Tax=Echinostoma caproni TaxID=27848 RepID=A0A183A432_9TREM|nr:unnamed protein product [Echinostoma caproni]
MLPDQMFWSMFGMVRQHLLPVRRPKVTFEIGGTKIESEIMQDLKKRILFQQHLKVVDVANLWSAEFTLSSVQLFRVHQPISRSTVEHVIGKIFCLS